MLCRYRSLRDHATSELHGQPGNLQLHRLPIRDACDLKMEARLRGIGNSPCGALRVPATGAGQIRQSGSSEAERRAWD